LGPVVIGVTAGLLSNITGEASLPVFSLLVSDFHCFLVAFICRTLYYFHFFLELSSDLNNQ
jgi:hypothetical protein